MAAMTEFPDVLRLIDEGAVTFRAAAASAPSVDTMVPTCPEWTLLELVQHLGSSHRRWAATVAAGPADGPPDEAVWVSAPDALGEREALVAWSAESTEELLNALREAGPDRRCWTWWGGSQSPQNAVGVARHQLQHVTVHAYDAQITQGAAQPLPHEAALDGVDEFLSTSVAGTDAWPHKPAEIDYHATDGRSWRLSLTAAGVQVTSLDTSGATDSGGAGHDSGTDYASLRGTASDLLLAFYSRVPVDSLEVGGDARVFDQLLAWDPDA